jgi:ubiquinone biosynthesis protein
MDDSHSHETYQDRSGGFLKLFVARRVSRYPGRYIEIFRVMRKYRLQHVAVQLGLAQLDGEAPAPRVHRHHDDHDDAANLAAALEELGPFFIKFGQVLSTRPDLLPKEYVRALTRLQDRITPVPSETVVRIIEEDLGKPISELFRSFDRTPLATASMAQVHRAVLPDGTEVAVKVQRPGVKQQTLRDMVVLREFVRFGKRYVKARYLNDLEQMLREMEESLKGDVDFTVELENTERISQQLGDFPRLMTPRVYREFSSNRVLTLSFIHGRPLSALTADDVATMCGPGIAKELLTAYVKQIVVDGVFHADPHPGNILIAADGRLALFDFGMVGRFDAGEKDSIINLLLAFAARQGRRVAHIYLDMIDVPEALDRRVFMRQVSSFVSRYHDLSRGRIGLGTALLELLRLADGLEMPVPSSMTLLAKAMFNLDGTLSVLSPELDPVRLIQEYMATVKTMRLQGDATSPGYLAWALDTWRLIDEAPRQSHAILDKLASDQMKLRIGLHFTEEGRRDLHSLGRSMVVGAAIVALGSVVASLLGNRRDGNGRPSR